MPTPQPPQNPQSEDQLQAQFWKHVWNSYPQLHKLMWAVPNSAIGKIRTQEQQVKANTLKATGLLSGVWDLHLFWHGCLNIIETKLPGQSLTVDRLVNGKKVYGQKEWGELMAYHGAIRHIYHSLEEGIAVIESILLS